MKVNVEKLAPTKARLVISASQAELQAAKQTVLAKLGRSVKIAGFREGHVPPNLLEKNLDPAQLQNEFLDSAVNRLYAEAVEREQLRPVASPEVNVTKFVPFTTLEFEAKVEAVGEVKLPDYKKFKLARTPAQVTAADVSEVLSQLQLRSAERKAVERAAKHADEVVIDFVGIDAESGQPISGADGKDFPLLLGSNSFIPGFEKNLIGLKPGEVKSFTLEFPSDYGVRTLQSRKVTFKTTVKKVQEVNLPKLDDAFVAKAGPFKTLAELKADIKKQLGAERQQEADRAYENQLIEKIAEQTEVAIPKALVDDEITALENQEKQNVAYRGQTWQEHLTSEGLTEEQHKEQKRPAAELRVKAGLALSAVAEQENLVVTPEELEIRLQLLKGQYPDPAMQTELAKPQSRREISARLLTEKTIDKLAGYATK